MSERRMVDDDGKLIPRCVDCNEILQWGFEIMQGKLCSLCGPGSVKHQQRKETTNQPTKLEIVPPKQDDKGDR